MTSPIFAERQTRINIPMRANFAVQLVTFCCATTAMLVFASMEPETAGYAGVRVGRLCFYNGTCSRAMGASLLVYRQGQGSDVYFQPCGEMVENEATYLGGNQIFGFGKCFHPSRTWLCLPSWLIASLWLVQLSLSRRLRGEAWDGHAWWSTLIVAALASIAMFVSSPMISITALTWLTVFLLFSWIGHAMRRVRRRNLTRMTR